MMVKREVLTEQTAKKYKAIQILGVVMIVMGIPIIALSTSTEPNVATAILAIMGVLVSGAGVITYILGRLLAWWHHG